MERNSLITDAARINPISGPVGESTAPPPIARAHPGAAETCSAWVPARTILGSGVRCSVTFHPPAWDDDLGPMPDWDLLKQPEPGFEFDQRVSW
jgi:hypothetical protein